MVPQGEAAGNMCMAVKEYPGTNCFLPDCVSWCSSTYNGEGFCTVINCTCKYKCP